MVLTNSKGEEENNIHFLLDFVSLTIPCSSKPSSSKFERKKQKSNIMVP
jgi:hypothetical protein